MVMSVSVRLMLPYIACVTVSEVGAGVHPVGCSLMFLRQLQLAWFGFVPTCKNYLPLIASCQQGGVLRGLCQASPENFWIFFDSEWCILRAYT